METTTFILNTTSSEFPESEDDVFSLGGSVFGIVFMVVMFCGCSGLCKCFLDRMSECSRRDIFSCDCNDCESAVRRCSINVSCVCSVCSICKSGARRCWGTITDVLGRRAERNSSTSNTSTETPTTDTAPPLSSVIVDHSTDPPPSMTLPPSYDSIVTNPSEPPPSYEEVMR